MNIYLENVRKSFVSLKWYEWIMIVVMVVIAGWAMIDAFQNPESSHNPAWLTVINFVSAIAGIICIFFTAKASISACIFGIINTVVYVIYLGYWHIYGTMCLEVLVYLPFNIIQWYVWAKHRDQGIRQLTMTKRLSYKACLVVGLAVLCSGFVYYAILDRVGGNVALLDAFTVAIGVIAVGLSAFRYREQYILWLITDIIAVAMYIIMFDPVYLTKKTIYLIMAFVGMYNWFKLNKERNELNV